MYLDEDKLPVIEGIYLVKETGYNNGKEEIEVHKHPTKGFCCDLEDLKSAGIGVDDATDCHVSVQDQCLELIKRLRI